jgi:hypothetical protein
MVRCFKIGDVVSIIPECFELTGLPIEASTELTVDEYAGVMHGRFLLEVRDEEGGKHIVTESEVRFIR